MRLAPGPDRIDLEDDAAPEPADGPVERRVAQTRRRPGGGQPRFSGRLDRAASASALVSRAWEGVRGRPAALTLVIAYLFGVGGIKAAYVIAAGTVNTDYILLFWLSFLAVLMTTAVIGVNARTGEATRWLLATVYGLFTFFPKFLMSVTGANYFDEFGHYRHAQDILANGSLNVTDNYLPITKYYPGTEALTVAVHLVTRLSLWHSGQLVVVLAHVASIVIVWQLARALRVPSRWAFLAGIIFSLNPSFMFFDTEYAYESLGLPLAMAAILFAVLARQSAKERAALLWSVAAALTASVVVFTHHISAAFVVVGVLGVALLVPTEWSRKTNRIAFVGPWVAGLLAGALLAIWVTTVAKSTIGYLEPHIRQTLTQLEDLILRRKEKPTLTSGGPTGSGPLGTSRFSPAPLGGQPAPGTTGSTGRHLFGGSGLPLYEVICGLVSPVVTALAVGAALVRVWWFRSARSALLRRAPFLILGIAYLATLPIDLTSSGGETAHRLWAYAYFGVAICAVLGGQVWREIAERLRVPHRLIWSIAFAALVVVTVGNVASGEDIYYRFPGPYVFGTDTRSRTPETYQVAQWCNTHIRPGTKVVTDRFTGEVIFGYTRLQIPAPSDSEVYKLYYEGNTATYGLRKYLRLNHFEYWILDTRIAYYNPVQKLFETYHGPANVDGRLLVQAGGTSLLRVVFRTQNYEVLAINAQNQ